MLLQHVVLFLHPGEEGQSRNGCGGGTYPPSPHPERMQAQALHHPRAVRQMRDKRAHARENGPGVRRVPDKGVRSRRDEFVVLADAELEGELPSQCAVARDAEDGPSEVQRPPAEEDWRDAEVESRCGGGERQ